MLVVEVSSLGIKGVVSGQHSFSSLATGYLYFFQSVVWRLELVLLTIFPYVDKWTRAHVIG
jgi:hypothetical protein